MDYENSRIVDDPLSGRVRRSRKAKLRQDPAYVGIQSGIRSGTQRRTGPELQRASRGPMSATRMATRNRSLSLSGGEEDLQEFLKQLSPIKPGTCLNWSTPRVTIGSAFHACNGITPAQEEAIEILKEKFPNLYVTAPVTNFWTQVRHHAGSSMIDFGGPRADLYKAWYMLGHSDLQGVFLLGLNRPNQGLTADIHLHVDLGSPKYVGYELTKKPTFINIQQDKSGTYNKLAREIYGIPPDWKPDPGDTLTKPSGDKCGAVQYAIMGALMGAAVGYEKDHYAKLALYAAGAGAAGWIVGKILCKFD